MQRRISIFAIIGNSIEYKSWEMMQLYKSLMSVPCSSYRKDVVKFERVQKRFTGCYLDLGLELQGEVGKAGTFSFGV